MHNRENEVAKLRPISSILMLHIPVKSSGATFIGKCPFHDDKKHSLEMNEFEGSFKCQVCKESGDVIDFVMKFKGISEVESLKFILPARLLNFQGQEVFN